MMEVYLLRHGEAEESFRIPDEERSLTPAGRRGLGDVLLRARAAGAGASLILASPLRRAVETAELAAEILGTHARILTTDALRPDAVPAEVWDAIRTNSGENQILLAGHEPLLSQAIAFLLGAPAAQIDMRKGSLARVDIDQFGSEPRGVLRWLITPQLAAQA
ncbi:MAG TPA: histidine phosphatase family protein [Bryobacteraceae bacterium]|nr:histidine phosphatase family protein [Bryobacteraceae bacterium]